VHVAKLAGLSMSDCLARQARSARIALERRLLVVAPRRKACPSLLLSTAPHDPVSGADHESSMIGLRALIVLMVSASAADLSGR
jgi:hypothetical protein